MDRTGYTYDADKRGWDLIPQKDPERPDADCLVVLEVTSGRRYGAWMTEAHAGRTREGWREVWDAGLPITGVMEWGDVTLRSAAVVAVHVPPGIAQRGDTTDGPRIVRHSTADDQAEADAMRGEPPY